MFGVDLSSLTSKYRVKRLLFILIFVATSILIFDLFFFTPKQILKSSIPQISIKDGQCIPSELKIKVGELISIKNLDLHSRRIFEVNGNFSTNYLRQNQDIKLVFTKVGSFSFKCEDDYKSRMQLIVEK